MTVLAAAARADATWTGASASPEWSISTNWSGVRPAPSAPAGMLTFPTLGACAACYTSHNGLTGVSALGLVFSNTTGGYQILGNSLSVGSQGISDSPGNATSTEINAPLVLSSPQTWSIGSAGANGYNVLTVLGGITGSGANALNVSFPAVYEADLFIDSDVEVGPVTVTGVGGLHLGGAPGSNLPGSVNGIDGQPVVLNGATLVANPGANVGPLALNGGTLLLGTNPQNDGTTTLHVSGSASLSSTATTRAFINDNGPSAGIDFSQLSVSGNVKLGGQLVLAQGPASAGCVTLVPGDVATLITTTGTLTGTYANAPEGTILTMASSCQGIPPRLQIHYAGSGVTATVVGGPPATSPAGGPGAAKPSQPKSSRGRVIGPRHRLMVVDRRISLRQKCQSTRLCRGSASLTITRRTGRRRRHVSLRCARARFRIPAHKSRTIRVRVTDACLRLLRTQRHHRLPAVYASKTSTGQMGQRQLITLLVKPPAKTRHRA